MRHPEQRRIKLMQSILRKFTKACQIAFVRFVDTAAADKACLLKNRRQNIFGCDMESDCVQQIKPSLVNFYSTRVLNPNSDIVGGKKCLSTSKITFLAMEVFYA